jgi:acetyltransferase-like isoleucine patch superfamily enzyme/acyl carrier protein
MRRRARTTGLRRHCTSVGETPTLDGKPTVVEANGGRIEIGHRFNLSSWPVPSHLISSGLLHIGDDVSIAHGAAVAATLRVSIGDRTRIGPFLVLMDTDFHGERAKPGARPTTITAMGPDSGYAPVAIGADVIIGSHVTILRGSTIGDRATIAAGSVVNGRIPPGTFARGVPARVFDGRSDSRSSEFEGLDAAHIVARVFGLSSRPDPHEGPADIPEWDSLGSLKLLLALEDALGLTLDADLLAGARTIADVQLAVDQARARR